MIYTVTHAHRAIFYKSEVPDWQLTLVDATSNKQARSIFKSDPMHEHHVILSIRAPFIPRRKPRSISWPLDLQVPPRLPITLIGLGKPSVPIKYGPWNDEQIDAFEYILSRTRNQVQTYIEYFDVTVDLTRSLENLHRWWEFAECRHSNKKLVERIKTYDMLGRCLVRCVDCNLKFIIKG